MSTKPVVSKSVQPAPAETGWVEKSPLPFSSITLPPLLKIIILPFMRYFFFFFYRFVLICITVFSEGTYTPLLWKFRRVIYIYLKMIFFFKRFKFFTDGKAEAHHYCAWPRSHPYIKMTGSKRPYIHGRRYVCFLFFFLGGDGSLLLLCECVCTWSVFSCRLIKAKPHELQRKVLPLEKKVREEITFFVYKKMNGYGCNKMLDIFQFQSLTPWKEKIPMQSPRATPP